MAAQLAFLGLLLKVGRGRGTWDLGLEDSGNRGRGDAETRGRGDSGTWDASASELGDAWGFEDVINK